MLPAIAYSLGAFTTVSYQGEDSCPPMRVNLVSMIACPSGGGKSIVTNNIEKELESFRKMIVSIMYSIFLLSNNDESVTPSETEEVIQTLTQVNINNDQEVETALAAVNDGKKKKFIIPKVTFQRYEHVSIKILQLLIQ